MAKFQPEVLHWINYIHLERISFISWCWLFRDLVKSHSAGFALTKSPGKCWNDCIPHFFKLHNSSTELAKCLQWLICFSVFRQRP